MKKLFFTLFPLVCLGQSEVVFQDMSWNEALNVAQSNDKLIFLYAYAEEQCEPCRALEKYTFKEQEAVDALEEDFLTVRFNMDEYPGIELAERYDIDILPALLFISADGEVVHRSCGAVDAGEIKELSQAALSEDNNLKAYQEKYRSGERSAAFLEKYMWNLEVACLDIDKFLADHFRGLSAQEMATEGNWFLMMEYVNDLYSYPFLTLLNNQEVFEASFGKEDVQAKILDVFEIAYYDLAASENFMLFGMRSLQYLAMQHDFDYKEDFINTVSFGMGEITEDWEMYATAAMDFIKPELEDPELLQDVAWKFYLFVDDENKLMQALEWAKYLLENEDPNPANIDIYASLLFKLGRVKDAIKYEKQALKLAGSWEQETSHYEYQLEKFRQGK